MRSHQWSFRSAAPEFVAGCPGSGIRAVTYSVTFGCHHRSVCGLAVHHADDVRMCSGTLESSAWNYALQHSHRAAVESVLSAPPSDKTAWVLVVQVAEEAVEQLAEAQLQAKEAAGEAAQLRGRLATAQQQIKAWPSPHPAHHSVLKLRCCWLWTCTCVHRDGVSCMTL